jgi:nitronate monooxygenase
MSLRTPLCSLLGIDLPIFQSGMGGVAGSGLALAVSNAGALGIFAGHGVGPEELVEGLREMRSGTDRPYGVNLLLPQDLVRPADAETISPQTTAHVNLVLNLMRQDVALEPASGLPRAPARNIEEKLEMILAAKVPILSIGLGNPGHDLVERCHRQGTKVIAMVATVDDAKAVAETGVDALVVQGSEAGGHRSHFKKPDDKGFGLVGSMVLIPEVVDSVNVPVIAAGGIVDGRSLVAALALGAQGVMLGTRFIATRESLVNDTYRQAILDATSGDTTVTDAASGRYARLIRNRFTDEYGSNPTLPFGWQGSATADLFDKARDLRDKSHMPLWAGQSAGRVKELVGAAEVIQGISEEAEQLFRNLAVHFPI